MLTSLLPPPRTTRPTHTTGRCWKRSTVCAGKRPLPGPRTRREAAPALPQARQRKPSNLNIEQDGQALSLGSSRGGRAGRRGGARVLRHEKDGAARRAGGAANGPPSRLARKTNARPPHRRHALVNARTRTSACSLPQRPACATQVLRSPSEHTPAICCVRPRSRSRRRRPHDPLPAHTRPTLPTHALHTRPHARAAQPAAPASAMPLLNSDAAAAPAAARSHVWPAEHQPRRRASQSHVAAPQGPPCSSSATRNTPQPPRHCLLLLSLPPHPARA